MLGSGPVQLITPKRHSDDRGWFVETYSEQTFAKRGIGCRFVQENHSLSRPAFTLRGIHFQSPPYAQAKLVRCVRGRVLDVAVDLRAGSPTFGNWVAAELTAEGGEQLFITIGFGHAFLTLEPDCEVVYMVSEVYAPAHDGGIHWNDADIAAEWPLPAGTMPMLSTKDAALPMLRDFKSPFPYQGGPLAPIH